MKEQNVDSELQRKMEKLWNICENYRDKHEVSCPESIYDCDWIILNAYGLLNEIFDIVGYYDDGYEDEEDE